MCEIIFQKGWSFLRNFHFNITQPDFPKFKFSSKFCYKNLFRFKFITSRKLISSIKYDRWKHCRLSMIHVCIAKVPVPMPLSIKSPNFSISLLPRGRTFSHGWSHILQDGPEKCPWKALNPRGPDHENATKRDYQEKPEYLLHWWLKFLQQGIENWVVPICAMS